jgi:cytochrome c peroxidase
VNKTICITLLVAAVACQPGEEQATMDQPAQASVAGLAALPATAPEPEGNPLTPVKIELGKMLFFDPRLSRSWLISCNTCHNLGLGGVDLLETSVGHGWQKGPRNSPTVLNAVFNVAQFWDGRAEDLKEQAMGPVQAAVEMSSTPDRVVATLTSIPEYRERFAEAFPEEADPVTFENMARAIEAFEATLLTPGSPFDRYLEGDQQALTSLQLEGLDLFSQKGCVGCHGGLNVGGTGYFPFGLVNRPDDDVLPRDDLGRYAVTQVAGEEYVFKAPSLRNVALTPPYFHSGAIWGLDEAVMVMGTAQLGTTLNNEERAAIVAFLQSLTGEQPVVEYPILPPHTAETPRPDIGTGAGSR